MNGIETSQFTTITCYIAGLSAWFLFPSSSVVYSRSLMGSSAFLEQIMSFLTGGGQKRCKPAEITEEHGFPALWLENLYSGQHCSIWVRKDPSVNGDGLLFFFL